MTVEIYRGDTGVLVRSSGGDGASEGAAPGVSPATVRSWAEAGVLARVADGALTVAVVPADGRLLYLRVDCRAVDASSAAPAVDAAREEPAVDAAREEPAVDTAREALARVVGGPVAGESVADDSLADDPRNEVYRGLVSGGEGEREGDGDAGATLSAAAGPDEDPLYVGDGAAAAATLTAAVDAGESAVVGRAAPGALPAADRTVVVSGATPPGDTRVRICNATRGDPVYDSHPRLPTAFDGDAARADYEAGLRALVAPGEFRCYFNAARRAPEQFQAQVLTDEVAVSGVGDGAAVSGAADEAEGSATATEGPATLSHCLDALVAAVEDLGWSFVDADTQAAFDRLREGASGGSGALGASGGSGALGALGASGSSEGSPPTLPPAVRAVVADRERVTLTAPGLDAAAEALLAVRRERPTASVAVCGGGRTPALAETDAVVGYDVTATRLRGAGDTAPAVARRRLASARERLEAVDPASVGAAVAAATDRLTAARRDGLRWVAGVGAGLVGLAGVSVVAPVAAAVAALAGLVVAGVAARRRDPVAGLRALRAEADPETRAAVVTAVDAAAACETPLGDAVPVALAAESHRRAVLEGAVVGVGVVAVVAAVAAVTV